LPRPRNREPGTEPGTRNRTMNPAPGTWNRSPVNDYWIPGNIFFNSSTDACRPY
jgi:hypothetical protein